MTLLLQPGFDADSWANWFWADWLFVWLARLQDAEGGVFELLEA